MPTLDPTPDEPRPDEPYDQDEDVSFLPDHTDDHYLNAMYESMARGHDLSPAMFRQRRVPKWRLLAMLRSDWRVIAAAAQAGPLDMTREVLVTREDIIRTSNALMALLKNPQVRAHPKPYRALKAAYAAVDELWGAAAANEEPSADDAKTPVMLEENI